MTEPVQGILPSPPAVSLLTSGSRRMTNVEWRSGVSFRGANCPTSGRWWYCAPGDAEDKPIPSGSGLATFLPFMVFVSVACDEVLPDREPELLREGEAGLDAVLPWHVSRELWTGEYETSGRENPSLQAPFPGETDEFNPDHIVNAGGALNPIDALGALAQAYADGTNHGGDMIVHSPMRLVPWLFHQGVAYQSGNIINLPNGRLSPGPGYPAGAGDWGPRTAANPTGAAATSGQVWLYATGMTEWSDGPTTIDPKDRARWFDRRLNKYTAIVERPAIVRFDPCSVFAVLVTLPTGA